MATTVFFEEEVTDQGKQESILLELGRSSYYSGAQLPDGETGTDSIYLSANGHTIILDLDTAKRFSEAVVATAAYLGLIDR